jgi:hypothetical protein
MYFLLFTWVFFNFNSRVVINEVMANPAGSSGPGKPEDRNEFIELNNISDEIINLAGWRITDFDAYDIITTWTDTAIFRKYPDVIINSANLLPHSFALILDPEYTMTTPLNGYVQPYYFPAGTLILTVGNTTIGDELQNNDPLLLFSPDSAESTCFGTPFDTTDSFPYSAGDGFSWERVSSTAQDSSHNWKVSIDHSGSTPGRENSIISFQDLAVYNFYPLPTQSDSTAITLSINIYNKGYQDAQNWIITIYNDLNFDHNEENSERLTLLQGNLLKAQTDTTLFFRWSNPPRGNSEVWAVLNYALDQDTTNNRMMTHVYQTQAKELLKFVSNLFSPDQDGYEDTLYIRFEVPEIGGKLDITVFDLKGSEITTLTRSKLREKTGSVYWDGKSKTGKKMTTGIYIIKLEYKIGSRIYEEKKSVVLAKKL